MELTVHPNGSVTFEVLLHAADRPEAWSFIDMHHFLTYFGTMLVMTSCEFRIRGVALATEPEGC